MVHGPKILRMTNTVQRYEMLDCPADMSPNESGEWVLYADFAKAVLAERERCAMIAEELGEKAPDLSEGSACYQCAAAIRGE
jgi:hypothetical protein